MRIEDLVKGKSFKLAGIGQAKLVSANTGIYFFASPIDDNNEVEVLGFNPEQLILSEESQTIDIRGNPGRTVYSTEEYDSLSTELGVAA